MYADLLRNDGVRIRVGLPAHLHNYSLPKVGSTIGGYPILSVYSGVYSHKKVAA